MSEGLKKDGAIEDPKVRERIEALLATEKELQGSRDRKEIERDTLNDDLDELDSKLDDIEDELSGYEDDGYKL